jgi:hypothetical protein
VGERTPRIAHIPQWSLSEVEPVASALVELAAPATNARVGQQMGVSPAGGKFRSKLGTARYYGLTRRQGNLLAITPRGEAVVAGDEDAARQARREAVMSTPFGPIIARFAGREPNEAIIAARLEDDYAVPAASSNYIAGVLIRAANQAELISNGRFDAAAIESVPVSSSQNGNGAGPGAQAERSASEKHNVKGAGGREKQAEKKGVRETVELPEGPRPFNVPVRVLVNVDASSWSPAQLAAFVRALREPIDPDVEVSEQRL